MPVPLLLPDDQEFFSQRGLLGRERGNSRPCQTQQERSHCTTSARGFRPVGKRLFNGVPASNTTLKNPTIISSQLWSPQVTSLVGSGLRGLFAELSKCAVHSMTVPLGRG